MLSGLYYPFSRCVDPCTLKQLLLVFDSVTFIEPVDDEEWRAKLFRDLERQADRFTAYRQLSGALQELRDEQAIVLRPPDTLSSLNDPATAASTLSDLDDSEWLNVADRPARFNLPYEADSVTGNPTWQIFPPKMPRLVRDALEDVERLRKHVIWHGGENYAWSLSYAAGSAVALNVHIAAAAELDLAPVTDSSMHHRLLLRKMARSVTSTPAWANNGSEALLESIAQQAAVDLVRTLLPRDMLASISYESILTFRENTKTARAAMVRDLAVRLGALVDEADPSTIVQAQRDIQLTIAKELREYQGDLTVAKERIWPGLVRTAGEAVTAGSAAAVAFQFLLGGAAGVIAGSIAGASLLLLKTALEERAEAKKLHASTSSAVAYLSNVQGIT
jgi:hypothetical protein